ncbi:hypothetical protein [Kordiimonas sp. SCSIO 12610]|uniref:hypothetical protein n=1 Tax=Kordiimonas sp. SCSIO 12610 TaxID=2829597 RepID=UPI00210C8EF2|nr:hypothetical protein [Kordiimonas sp. SCSIO 12610]UTW56607.1 hypothetical protein KFF44_06840 [Kordiimonas sp. SCSIO 12610]
MSKAEILKILFDDLFKLEGMPAKPFLRVRDLPLDSLAFGKTSRELGIHIDIGIRGEDLELSCRRIYLFDQERGNIDSNIRIDQLLFDDYLTSIERLVTTIVSVSAIRDKRDFSKQIDNFLKSKITKEYAGQLGINVYG